MKVIAKNKRATFDYEILEQIEAGIVLTGQEVKSVRGGNVDLKGAYVSLATGKPVLKKASIQPYRYASNLGSYDPGRDRELLLKKSETERLFGKAEEKGISILPMEFRAGRTIKVLLGIGRGRKKYDKRQRIKERETEKRFAAWRGDVANGKQMPYPCLRAATSPPTDSEGDRGIQQASGYRPEVCGAFDLSSASLQQG